MLIRCPWAKTPLSIAYHDDEWGRPVQDDRTLFEFLILEGAQAGLSWETVLKKRENYHRAFAGFDPKKVARFDAKKCAALLLDEGIIRNRLKIASAVRNANVFLALQKEFGGFAEFLRAFTHGKPIVNRPRSPAQVPARTELSDRISKELKQRGMNFVGSTIIYAYLQAVGVVDDHLASCHRAKNLCRKTAPIRR